MYIEQKSHLIFHLCIKDELEQIFSHKALFTPSTILILSSRNTIQRLFKLEVSFINEMKFLNKIISLPQTECRNFRSLPVVHSPTI